MDSSEDAEVLSKAIEKLLDEKRNKEDFSKVFSQLESSVKPRRRTDETRKEEEEQSPVSSLSNGKQEDKKKLEESIEEIAKDIRKVKKQNKVTQILLSTMIFLTLAWQLSEYSMLYIIKDRLTHPIRSIRGLLSGIFKSKIRPIKNQLPSISSSSKEQNEQNIAIDFQMPEVLKEFGFNDDEDR